MQPKMKLLLFTGFLTLILAMSGCASGGKTGDAPESASKPAAAAEKSTVFELYDKVKLGMTKDQVDAELKVPAEADTTEYAPKGSFRYRNDNSAVAVIYNSNNIVFSKTVIYGSHADIAPLTKTPVTEEQSKKIQDGADYKDIVALLNGEGVECSTTGKEADAGSPGVIRRWANQDGSCIQIVFGPDNKAGHVLFFDAH